MNKRIHTVSNFFVLPGRYLVLLILFKSILNTKWCATVHTYIVYVPYIRTMGRNSKVTA